MKDRILFVIIALASTLCIQSQTLTPTALLGNWSNPETQQWEYGFFEDFAIYQDDFWEYESIRMKGNNANIILKKGSERHALKIALNPQTDSLCILTPTKGKKRPFVRYTRQPDYTQPDHRAFADNGFRHDSVTIIGFLRNAKRDFPFNVSVPDWLHPRQERNYDADIDSCGRFRITVPLLNTGEIFLDWQERGVRLFTAVEPGETLFVYHDYKNQDTRFMGKNARIHQELKALNVRVPNYRWYDSPKYNSDVDHLLFLKQQKESYHTAVSRLDQYIADHPMVSDRFKQFTHATLLFVQAGNIMQRRFELRRAQKERFPKAYMTYADSLYAAIEKPYTLTRDISQFLNDYFDYYNEEETTNITMGNVEALRYLDKQGRYTLTAQQKSDLKDYERALSLSHMGRYMKLDSTVIAQQVEPYKEIILRTAELLKNDTLKQFVKENTRLIPQLMELKQINNSLLFLDLVSVPPLMKEIMVTKVFKERLYQVKKPLGEQSIQQFNQWVTNPALKDEFFTDQAYYEKLEQQSLDYIASLKTNDELKDDTNPVEILRKLTEPYKGKVIYIDIWGTWCGPCKQEMKQMPPIKKKMEGKEVVFMYLANNSPEDSWKNVIKENHLTSPQIVHYNLPNKQQKLLEQHLEIRSYPTYLLINKQGELIKTKVPRPSQGNELCRRLTELLEE